MARLIVVAGPSGVGKTSLVKGLVARRPEIVLSVSATTRQPRPDERDGVEYRFLSAGEFARLEAEGAFLEAATVFGADRYGTPRAPVQKALGEGRDVVLEIDVQGARAVRAAVADAILVFVEPPSWEELEARLVGRETEDPEAVARRLETARAELGMAGEFDHRLVNDDLRDAVERLIRILEEPQLGSPGPAGPGATP